MKQCPSQCWTGPGVSRQALEPQQPWQQQQHRRQERHYRVLLATVAPEVELEGWQRVEVVDQALEGHLGQRLGQRPGEGQLQALPIPPPQGQGPVPDWPERRASRAEQNEE